MKEKRGRDESVIVRKQRSVNHPAQSDSRDAVDTAADTATDADVQVMCRYQYHLCIVNERNILTPSERTSGLY